MDFNNYSNAGYLITKWECFEIEDGRNYYIVLGERKTRFGEQFVTWECKVECDEEPFESFYWGHYFAGRIAALEDYHERLLKEYKRQLGE